MSEDIKKRKDKAREMLRAGVDPKTVMKETGLSMAQIAGIARWLKARRESAVQRQIGQGVEGVKAEAEGPSATFKGVKPPSELRFSEGELWAAARPIIRKIALNPKVFLWYDYAVSRLGYKGDLVDMLIEALEDFWASRGYKIKIVREEAD